MRAVRVHPAVSAIVIAATILVVALPRSLCSCSKTKPKVSRAKTDLRSLATALESYHADYQAYPPNSSTVGDFLADHGSRKAYLSRVILPPSITTPLAYVTSLYPDPFADDKGLPFYYYNFGEYWILYSAGPDVWIQLDAATLPVLDVYTPQAFAALLAPYTYDPTNGTISPGEIWRAKE